MIEDAFGASLSYSDVERVFSIGCSEGKARASVASLPVADARDVSVRLSGSEGAFFRVDRALPGIVAEATLTAAWIDALAEAEDVSVVYGEGSFGPLQLPADWRSALAERCQSVIGGPSRFP